ncbi:MAG: carbohydrate ABC transporter substrate-binding protein, partial [Bacillota bacterium]
GSPIFSENHFYTIIRTQLVGVTKYFILDGEQNSPAQQQAAKDFLNWLVYDPEGQKRLVVDASIIPAFKNITITPEDPLAASIMEYVQKGRTITFVLNLPADHWAEVGASMQKYLADYADRDTLLAEVEAYWRGL